MLYDATVWAKDVFSTPANRAEGMQPVQHGSDPFVDYHFTREGGRIRPRYLPSSEKLLCMSSIEDDNGSGVISEKIATLIPFTE